jgi:HNH endonuclease
MSNHGPIPRLGQNTTKPATKYGPKPKPLADRFWSKVLKSAGHDSCWLWTGHVNGKCGYGMIYDADVGDKMLAHRVAWKLAFGSYPSGVVRHTCGNPSCVRIDHLVEGTQAENMLDMVSHGRHRNQCGGEKLSFEQAEEIRDLYRGGKLSQSELASLYEVHQGTISRVILGKTFRVPRIIQELQSPRIERIRAPRRSIEERFWEKVDKKGPAPVAQPELESCWLWTASTTDKVSPRGSFRRTHLRAELAHRVAWELTYGPIPEGLVVCHRCDVGLCVRPTHLFLGTQAENLEDMRSKGRAKFWGTPG